MKVALFAGSFRPFTIGHYDILCRALTLFDRVVVMCGVNCHKACGDDSPSQNLEAVVASLPGAELMEWDGLTVDAAKACGAQFLLRGARTVADFEYERNLADVNRLISGLDTVILLARPELASVSSSMVRELHRFGRDVSRFLPKV